MSAHSTKENASFQDPLIRPDVNLQFLGILALVALPLTLLFLVLAKEPTTEQPQTFFKPVSAQTRHY